MLNTILTSIAFLVALANKAISAMTTYAAQLGLPYTTETDLPTRLAELHTANAAHQASRTEMSDRRVALLNAVNAARTYIQLVRDSLKSRLGSTYSQSWDAVGLSGALRIPTKADPLLNVLQLMKVYLTAQPIVDGGANVAAARAQVLHDALVTAIAGIAQQKDAVALALETRNAKAKALEQGLRTLLSELHQALGPMDARWLSFGFFRPGQKQSPERPDNVSVTLIGLNAAAVKWKKTARAEYYRVWKRVIGVDEGYIAVGSPADLDFTLESLPAGAQMEIAVSAMNSGGESALSEVVLVATL